MPKRKINGAVRTHAAKLSSSWRTRQTCDRWGKGGGTGANVLTSKQTGIHLLPGSFIRMQWSTYGGGNWCCCYYINLMFGGETFRTPFGGQSSVHHSYSGSHVLSEQTSYCSEWELSTTGKSIVHKTHKGKCDELATDAKPFASSKTSLKSATPLSNAKFSLFFGDCYQRQSAWLQVEQICTSSNIHTPAPNQAAFKPLSDTLTSTFAATLKNDADFQAEKETTSGMGTVNSDSSDRLAGVDLVAPAAQKTSTTTATAATTTRMMQKGWSPQGTSSSESSTTVSTGEIIGIVLGSVAVLLLLLVLLAVRHQHAHVNVALTETPARAHAASSEPNAVSIELGPHECCICMDQPASHTVVPCGHMCYCVNCAAEMKGKVCAMCKTASTNIIRTYL